MLPLPCSYGPAITSEEKAGERMAFKRLFYEVGRVQPSLSPPSPLRMYIPFGLQRPMSCRYRGSY